MKTKQQTPPEPAEEPQEEPQETEEPQEEPQEEPEETAPSPTISDSPSMPAANNSQPADETVRQLQSQIDQVLAAVQKSAQLQVQNLELVTSRVDQMGNSLADVARQQNEAFATLKTSAELMQEFMAALNEQTERLVTVAAALIRYSQEQQAMVASGGSQA